jgi:hypothetical protein
MTCSTAYWDSAGDDGVGFETDEVVACRRPRVDNRHKSDGGRLQVSWVVGLT